MAQLALETKKELEELSWLNVDCNLVLYFVNLAAELRCYHFDSTVSQVSINNLKSLTNDYLLRYGKNLAVNSFLHDQS